MNKQLNILLRRILRPLFLVLVLSMLVSFNAQSALAEGSVQTGLNQPLSSSSPMTVYVDILTAGEVINVSLDGGSFDIYDPSGALRVDDEAGGQVTSGDLFNAPITTAYKYTTDMAGTWRIELAADTTYRRYDFTVTASTSEDPDPGDMGGRVHAYMWSFNAGTYAEAEATDADYYVLVPGGRPNTNYVWELDLNKFAGFVYQLIANDLGVDAPNSGYSVPMSGNSWTPKWPMYLAYPTVANPIPGAPPVVSNLRFVDDEGVDISITPSSSPGTQDSGAFEFTSDTSGTYSIIIDTNQDGQFAGGDRLLLGNVVVGENQIEWDGFGPGGATLEPDIYNAQVEVRMGEYHFLSFDAETSGGTEDGLTICQTISSTEVATDTLVFWDDATFLSGTTTLPDGELCSTSAGRHTWGDFSSGGFGNERYIDTYVYGLKTAVATEAMIAADDTVIYSPHMDLDADDSSGATGTDYQAAFVAGGGSIGIADTDIVITDSDSITLTRGEITLSTWRPGDMLTVTGSLPAGISIDPSSTAYQIILVGEGTMADYEAAIQTVTFDNPAPGPGIFAPRTVSVRVKDELSNSSPALTTIYMDSDGDSIPDHVECTNEADCADTDDDGTPDYLDADDDNDGIPTSVEVDNAPPNGDTDGDGIPDHLDLDSDNDGINDVQEGGGTDADGDGMHDGPQGELTDPPDTDGDGQPDYVDLDSDNDTVSDLIEGGSGATDADNDGVADGPDADGDGIVDDADDNDAQFGEDGDSGPQDTDGDNTPDYIDTDSDDNGFDDIDEAGNSNLDGDNDGQVDDDTDNDNDGIPDNADDDDDVFGGLANPDTDGDGIPNSIDIDDDNDGIPDSVEIANAPANGDTDGDGVLDHLDLDSDNDGINDVHEGGGTDADGDGMHDGTQGTLTDPPDTDGDGQPDYVDLDSDNDTVSDLVEGGSGATDADDDGVADGPDADGDGIVDDADDNDALFGEDSDGAPQDTDGDDTPDYIDTDSDDNGIDDIDEVGNGDLDGDDDGQVDDGTDADGDGIPDSVDDADADFGGLGTTDTDGDGIADYIDIDDDNDGIPDSVEMANSPAGTLALPGGDDTDGDGIPDHRDLDSDNDGINDVIEGGGTDANGDGMHDGTQGTLTDPPDTDGDGQPDYVDLDSDNDTVSDLIEGGSGATDADDDGVADGPDADGDGIVDDADDNDDLFGEDNDSGPQDSDDDSIPDYIDLDSDGDGVNDIDENNNGDLDEDNDGRVDDDTDVDGDGIPDIVDNDDDVFGGLGTNRPPAVQDDEQAVPEGIASTLDVLANDSDPEGETLTITQVSAPGHGVATTDGATLVYTPTAGYLGTDILTYTASDGELEATAQVTLTVSPVADLDVSQRIEATFGGYDIFIVARNLGPRPAPGAVISDTFPAIVDQVTWTCVSAGGASCGPSGTAGGGSGQVLNETLPSFPAGGVVTYTITSRSSSSEISYNTVTIAPPEGVFDLYMDNNSASRPTSYRIIFPIIFKYAYTGPTR